MSQAKGKLHNGDAPKSASDTVGKNSYVNSESSTTSDNTPCSDKKRETRVKRRERGKEESATDKKPSTKDLTELDKYWKVVEDNPSDFTGWTYLLQYVEQEKNMATVHKAFDAFLAHYPYCYGYWKKYADLEKEPDKAEEVSKTLTSCYFSSILLQCLKLTDI
ncbi:hypothetical protein NP493_7556g00005 [Ridgeia piscesae]|uniref:Pre-mRNA-processing factor 39 n=1 Tax=Ridgeia piscesae TaxID=27915 RepID=A0AAD9IPX7_RIDPI|nr:hypothetical protein NP493_7556g00005 [Ridgeia piscesae]